MMDGTQYCKTETVLLIFSFLQTNLTSQMRPNRQAEVRVLLTSGK